MTWHKIDTMKDKHTIEKLTTLSYTAELRPLGRWVFYDNKTKNIVGYLNPSGHIELHTALNRELLSIVNNIFTQETTRK